MRIRNAFREFLPLPVWGTWAEYDEEETPTLISTEQLRRRVRDKRKTPMRIHDIDRDLAARHIQTVWKRCVATARRRALRIEARRKRVMRQIYKEKLKQRTHKASVQIRTHTRDTINRDSRCTLILKHDEIDAITGEEKHLAFMPNPTKTTVAMLYDDVASVLQKHVRFTLAINQKLLPRSKNAKKLYQMGAFAGGIFVLHIKITQ